MVKVKQTMPVLRPAQSVDLCAACGGDLRVEPLPKSRAGCGCAVRAVAAGQRDYVNDAAARGTITDLEWHHYLKTGSFPGPDTEKQ